MPGQEPLQVKCEPPSDEDSNSQFTQHCNDLYSAQCSSIIGNVKLELHAHLSSDNGNVSAHLLHLQSADVLEELAPAGPAATRVCVKPEPREPALLQTLEPQPRDARAGSTFDMDRHMMFSEEVHGTEFVPLLPVKDEPLSEGEQQQLSGDDTSSSSGAASPREAARPAKAWGPSDMERALEALRKHNMSLTKASATFGIPSTTLWQRAHRLGIDTPKKDGAAKSWSPHTLRAALHALRAGALSANKASKAYGIPSSTLYKIARREGIRLAAPFNAAPTAWSAADLARALHAIRAGRASVQRASAQFGIPTGTLYGRCKREGIELSRSNPTPWSEDAMGEALEAVRVGQMSINQAAIHYNLPYSSLYGRFKRCKYQPAQQLQPMSHQNVIQDGVEADPGADILYAQYQNQLIHHHAFHQPIPDHVPQSYLHHEPTNEFDHTHSHHVTSLHDSSSMGTDAYSEQVMYYTQHGITTS